jgi:hypothetical protein
MTNIIFHLGYIGLGSNTVFFYLRKWHAVGPVLPRVLYSAQLYAPCTPVHYMTSSVDLVLIAISSLTTPNSTNSSGFRVV